MSIKAFLCFRELCELEGMTNIDRLQLPNLLKRNSMTVKL